MKIKIDTEGVVIGSRTLPEYKLQVLNFMNMLWDNITNPDWEKFHESDDPYYIRSYTYANFHVAAHNLKFELGRLEKETGIPACEEQEMITKMECLGGGNGRTEEIWTKLLKDLTKKYNLKYKLNGNRSTNSR